MQTLRKIKTWLTGLKAVQTLILGVRIVWNMLAVLVPAALCAYMIWKNSDIVVLGVAVALGLFALVRLCVIAYRAEAK